MNLYLNVTTRRASQNVQLFLAVPYKIYAAVREILNWFVFSTHSKRRSFRSSPAIDQICSDQRPRGIVLAATTLSAIIYGKYCIPNSKKKT